MIDMAAAYAATVNGGYAVFPFGVRDIRGTDGQVLYRHMPAERVRVISEKAQQYIKQLQREVVLNGTGKKARSVSVALGKTGTSQNYRDAWFIGSNAKYTAAVWVGNDDNSPMKEVGGGSVPTEIWTEIMK